MSEQEKTEFQKEHLTVEVEKQPYCKAALTISADAPTAQQHYEKAIKRIRKSVSMPGFRKGKAPIDLILKTHSPEIEQEFRELYIQSLFHESLELTKLIPTDRRDNVKADIQEVSKEQGAKLTLTFEHRPEVPSIDPSKLTLTKPEQQEVSEKQIENGVDDLRYLSADWESVNEPIQPGFKTKVHLEVMSNNAFEPAPDSPFEITVREVNQDDWLVSALIGLSVDEEKELEAPKNDEKSPTEKMRIRIESVMKPELPEATDELAKKYGAESLDDLKVKIKSRIQKGEEEAFKDNLRKQVVERLIEQYSFDCPASYLEEERANHIQVIVYEMHQKGMSDDQIADQKDQIEAQATEMAENSVRINLLLRQLNSDEKLQVERDTVIQEYMMQRMQALGAEAMAQQDEHMEENIVAATRTIAYRNALDWLIDHANVA